MLTLFEGFMISNVLSFRKLNFDASLNNIKMITNKILKPGNYNRIKQSTKEEHIDLIGDFTFLFNFLLIFY